MRPISVGEVLPSYVSKISLQSRIRNKLLKHSDSLSVVTGIVAVAVWATTFIALVVLIVRGS